MEPAKLQYYYIYSVYYTEKLHGKGELELCFWLLIHLLISIFRR